MKFLKKALVVLAVAVSALFIFCGNSARLPRGTFVDGVEVGGLSRTAAISAVRAARVGELKGKTLAVYAGGCCYKFTYPQFNFCDDLPKLVGGIRGGGSYLSHTTVYLNGAESVVSGICAAVNVPIREPCALFMGGQTPFEYCPGNDGLVCDSAALLADINLSLNSDFRPVVARFTAVARSHTLEEVKRGTQKLSSFTTYFDKTNAPRAHNIALACSRLNCLKLAAGGALSFNSAVGPRTSARGFLPAKIISGGRFVQGVGGGVCQVSTTLYNAALLAGLQIDEYHPHSLRVSYVPPSRDAMVSGNYFDLKLKNASNTPAYIAFTVGEGSLTCSVYGTPDGTLRSLESRVCGEDENGLQSLGYLWENGVPRLIRKDCYAPPLPEALP